MNDRIAQAIVMYKKGMPIYVINCALNISEQTWKKYLTQEEIEAHNAITWKMRKPVRKIRRDNG